MSGSTALLKCSVVRSVSSHNTMLCVCRVGQCGHGTEGQDVMIPRLIEHFDYKIDTGLLVSCGMEHSLALVSSISKDLTVGSLLHVSVERAAFTVMCVYLLDKTSGVCLGT